MLQGNVGLLHEKRKLQDNNSVNSDSNSGAITGGAFFINHRNAYYKNVYPVLCIA